METSAQLRAQIRRLSRDEFAEAHEGLFLGLDVEDQEAFSEDYITQVGEVASGAGSPTALLAPLAKREGSNGFSFVTLGRATNNDIVLPVNGISKCHLVFNQVGDTYTVTDAGSKFGTVFKGRRLERNHSEVIRPGDMMSLAGVVTLMVLDPAAAYTWYRASGRRS